MVMTAPCKDNLAQIADVPPSAQAIYCALFEHDPMTGAQIREATGLPRRTVYSALQRLKDAGVLHSQLSLRDTRQTYFWVDTPRLSH